MLPFQPHYDSDIPSYDADTTTLTIGLVGKYPIPLGSIVVFPFAGFDFSINIGANHYISYMEDNGKYVTYDAGDIFNRLSILLGIGADFNISDSTFLRTEVGYGIGLNSKFEDGLPSSANVTNGKVLFKVALGFNP